MKQLKSKATRLMALLLIAVLMTTSAVGRTLANYLTVGSVSDTARVAKWGVTVTADSSKNLFNTEYSTRNKTKLGEYGLDVESSAKLTDKLVAPGTEGYTSFKIEGTPEVAAEISFFVEDGYKAICLPAGTYTTTAGTVETGDVYEPIKWYFGTEEPGENTLYTMSLSELQAAVASSVNVFQFKPNETLNETFYIGWQWAYQSDVSSIVIDNHLIASEKITFASVLNTVLGDEALTAAQEESISFGVIVMQIEDYMSPVDVPIPEKDDTKFYKADLTEVDDPAEADIAICDKYRAVRWDGAGIDQPGIINSNKDTAGKENTEWIFKNTNLEETSGTVWNYCALMRKATGDDSWYVPAAGELKEKYPNGVGNSNSLWTSTESDWDPSQLAFSYMPNGNLNEYASKEMSTGVILFRG